MPVKLRNVLALALVIAVVGIGVFVGKKVSAAGVDPGSQGDPLVAKSYVDSQISSILDRLTKLEKTVAQLQKNGSGNQSSSQTPSAPVKQGVVSGTYVNLRTGPGTSNKTIGALHKGDTAQVLGTQSGWYKIKISNGTVGWVAGWLFAVK